MKILNSHKKSGAKHIIRIHPSSELFAAWGGYSRLKYSNERVNKRSGVISDIYCHSETSSKKTSRLCCKVPTRFAIEVYSLSQTGIADTFPAPLLCFLSAAHIKSCHRRGVQLALCNDLMAFPAYSEKTQLPEEIRDGNMISAEVNRN